MFDYHHWLNRFPGTNFHELNIDWLVEAVKCLAREMHDFEMVNQFSYEGVWDISKQYKKYAIVTDNNKAYISIDLVPAGIQIDNPDYWVLVANFTQEIADLGNRVIALESDTAQLRSIADGASHNLSVVVFGDSYGYADYLDGNPYPAAGYIKKLKAWLHLDDAHYHYNAVSGSGMNNGLWSAFTGLPTFANEDKVDLVISQCGINDRDSISDIVTGIGNYAARVKNRFPNAKMIHFLTMGSFQGGDILPANIDTFLGKLHDIWDKYEEGCRKNNIELVTDTVLPMLLQSNFYSDMYHPNADGHTAIASIMASTINGKTNYGVVGFYQGGTADNVHISNTQITAAPFFTGGVWIRDDKRMTIANTGVKTLSIAAGGIDFQVTDGEHYVEVGSLKSIIVSPNLKSWRYTYHVPCAMTMKNDGPRHGTLVISILNGKIYIGLVAFDDNNQYYSGDDAIAGSAIHFTDHALDLQALPF